jgi:hypothetical protein
VRIVADPHILVFYLFEPARLSAPALEALLTAENTDGIVASAASIGDLCYASHKTGPKSLAPGVYESVRRTLLDPGTNLEVAPVLASTMEYFTSVRSPSLATRSIGSFWRRRRNYGCRW